jgi:hypothetical protein
VPTIPVVEDFKLGHPKAAAFISTSEDFQIHRKFIYLHNRLLLAKQVEIVQLEKRLNELDSSEDEDNKRFLKYYGRELDQHNHTVEEERKVSERVELFTKLEKLLTSYGKKITSVGIKR